MRLPVPAKSYAVLIGTSTYRDGKLAGLPAVRHNLDDLAEVLTDPGLSGLPADHCVVVPDPADVRTVYRELQQHAARATDTLIVYFAGHGLTGSRNELFLGLTDTATDELPVSALAYDLLRDVVAESPARNRVVILDCCFSGRAAGDMAGEDALHGQVGIEGTYVLAATSANAVALAPPGARHTAFTGELLQLLRSGVPEGPELLTFGTIYRHLLHTTRTRGLPVPRQRGTGTADLLALSRNPAHGAAERVLPTTPEHAPPASRRSRRIWQVAAAALGVACTALLALLSASPSSPGAPWTAVSALSLLQGLTAHLPVSSSSHLRLAGQLLFDQSVPAGALVTLIPVINSATAVALLAFFAGDVGRALRATTRGPLPETGTSAEFRLGWYLVIAAGATAISAPLLGWLMPRPNLWLIAAGFTTTAVLLGLAEKIGGKQRERSGFTARDGRILGAAYLGATVLPGTSSLAATLAAGLLLGFTRSAALRLTLLFAVAFRATAMTFGLILEGTSARASTGPTPAQMIVGALITFVVAYASIAGLLWYVRRHTLYPFAVYLLVLGVLVVTAVATGVLSAS